MSIEEIIVNSEDFKFVNHRNPKRFFSTRPRPFRLIQTSPKLASYPNVVYTPATRMASPNDGALYDQERNRIDDACIRWTRNDHVMNIEPRQYPGDPDELPFYDKPVLYLGFLHPHYGHFLIDTLSYWWGLIEEHKDVQHYLVHIHDQAVLQKSYMQTCLSAMGVNNDNLVYFDKPVRLREVIIPSQSIQLESHVYTKFKASVQRLVLALDIEDVRPTDQPLYISRQRITAGTGKFIGEDQLESFLAERGVRVVHPQFLPFREQVKLFNEHKNIIGIVGSGMHNIIFSLEPKNVLYLTPHGLPKTFFLLDKCFDATSTYMMATRRLDKYPIYYRKLFQKMGGKLKPVDGFWHKYHLDLPRLFEWFTTSGYI